MLRKAVLALVGLTLSCTKLVESRKHDCQVVSETLKLEGAAAVPRIAGARTQLKSDIGSAQRRLSAWQKARARLDSDVKVPEILDARSKVRATTRCGNCDPKDPRDSVATLRGAGQVKEWLESFKTTKGVIFGKRLDCRGECCSFPGVDLGVGHNLIVLEEVCFKKDAGLFVDTTRITLTSH